MSDRSGLFTHVGASRWRRERLLILCYHGVALHDEHEWDPLLYVSAETFQRRLEIIRESGCTVLGLAEGVRRLYSGELPDRSVVLTFDDGYFDFKQCAWPLLSRHEFPATVYLTTQRCEHNFPIARLLASYVLWKQRQSRLDGRGIAGLGTGTYSLTTSAERTTVLELLTDALSSMRPAAKDSAVRVLTDRLGLDYEMLRAQRTLTLMNPSEVADAAAAGVDIQLHTHRHKTPEDPHRFAEELTTNRDRIAQMTGVRPSHFCYPSGRWRGSYFSCLRAEGIESATTCAKGMADATSDRFLLPRVLDGENVTDDEFRGWLTGAAAWLPHRRDTSAVPA